MSETITSDTAASPQVAWDPETASQARQRVYKERRNCAELRQNLAKMAGTSLVDKTFTVQTGSGPQVMTGYECANFWEEQAEVTAGEIEQYGGTEYSQTAWGISYAGEIPSRIMPNPPPKRENLPA